MSYLIDPPTTAELLQKAARATSNAQDVRAHHARRSKPGTKQRNTDIALALDRLAKAMRPIRSRIAKLPYNPIVEHEEELLRAASFMLQRERRKLWKMNKPRRK